MQNKRQYHLWKKWWKTSIIGIVHGTYLLGLVSGLIATTSPGPGTVVTAIEVGKENLNTGMYTIQVRKNGRQLGPWSKYTGVDRIFWLRHSQWDHYI